MSNEHSIVLKLDANGVAAGIEQTTKSLNDLAVSEDKVTESTKRLTAEQKQQYDLYKINSTAASTAAKEAEKYASQQKSIADTNANYLLKLQINTGLITATQATKSANEHIAIVQKRDTELHSMATKAAANLAAIEQRRDIEINNLASKAASDRTAIEQRRDMELRSMSIKESNERIAIEQRRDIELNNIAAKSTNDRIAIEQRRQIELHNLSIKSANDRVAIEQRRDLEINSIAAKAAAERSAIEQRRDVEMNNMAAKSANERIAIEQRRAIEMRNIAAKSASDAAAAPYGKNQSGYAVSEATVRSAYAMQMREESAAIAGMDMAARKAAESKGILAKYSHQFMRTLVDLTPIISGLGLLTLAHGAIQATDQYTKLTSQLKIATNSTSEYAFAMSEVKRISSAAQVDIGAIGSLYQRLSLATQASGTSQKEVALITETVSLGLKANGASARESASAMLQLSQSFGSGRMAGEEFNSMAEAAPNVLRALATSMGVPYGALKQLASEGKITTDVMVKAFTDPALLASFQEQAKSMRTITGSWVELTNALVLYVGETSKASGGVSVISGAITLLANNVKLIGDTLVIVSGVLLTRFVGALVISAGSAGLATIANISLIASLTGMSFAYEAASMAIGTATVAMKAFNLTNPIGWITLLVGAGITAWALWGESAADAAKKAEEELKKTSKAIDTSAWDKLAEKYQTSAYILEQKEKEKQAILAASYSKQAAMGQIYQDSELKILQYGLERQKNALGNNSDSVKKELEAYYKEKTNIEVAAQQKAISEITRIQSQTAEQISVMEAKGVKKAKEIHESKMARMAIEIDAKISAEGKSLSEEEKVNKAWAEIDFRKLSAIEKRNELDGHYSALAKARRVDEITAANETKKAYEKIADEITKVGDTEIKHLDDAIVKQRLHNESIGKTPEQIALVKKAIEEETIAQLEINAARLHGASIQMDTSGNKEAAAIYLTMAKDADQEVAKHKTLVFMESEAAIREAKKAASDIEKAANKKLWTDIDGFAHTAFNNITMKGKSAFAEIGKAIKESILDMLYKMTIQKWIFQIGGVSGGVAGAGAAGATDMFGGGSGGGGLGGLLNAGSSIYSAITGGVADAVTNIGVWAFNSGAETVGSALIGSASTIGTIVPWIGAAMAIVALFDSFSSSSTSITGSGLNIAGKVGAPSTSGYTTGVTESSSWWGLSSSSSSWRTGSAASKEVNDAISSMFAQIRGAIVLSGAAIGKDATTLDNQIANYTISIGDLSLAGMDAAKQQEAITKAVSGMADSMVAQLVPGMEKFQQANETLLQTLVRVATEVMTLNGFYLSLGVTTRATTASADKLSVALGGVTQASALMTSFVAGFAPEAQKTALALGTLKSAGLGVAEFLTTTQSWWEFAKVASTEQLAAILKNQDVIKSWVTAMDVSSKAVNDNITALQNKAIADYNAARQATDSLRAFAVSVRELQRSLWAGSQTPLSSTYDVTRSQFSAINASAGAGDTKAQGNLSGAATAFLDASKKQAVSAIEYARDFAMVQNALSDTAFKAEVTVTVAEAQLTVMELIHKAILDGNEQSYLALLSVQSEINLAKLAGTLVVDTLRGTVIATTDKQISGVDIMNQSVLRITDPSGGLITAQIEVQKAIDAAKITGSIDIATLSGIVSAATLSQILATNGVSNTVSTATLQQVAASQQIKTEVINNAGYTAKVTDTLNTGTNPILDSMGAWLNSINTQSSIQTQSLQYLLQASISASETARMAVVEQAITKLTSEIAGAVGGTYSKANLSRTTGAAGDTALSYAGAFKTTSGTVSSTGAASALSETVSASQGAAKVEADRQSAAAATASVITPTIAAYSASNPNPANVAAKAAALTAAKEASWTAANSNAGSALTRESNAWAAYYALPAFAVGTNEVPFDMNARIHAGEEIKPRAYVEKDKEDKKETNELLRKLVAANDEMKKELIAIKSSNYRIQVVEEKWDIDGTPAVRAA